MKAIVWSKNGCAFCRRAKKYLECLDIDIEERNVSETWSREALFEAVPDAKTLPQIFIDGKYVGGYTELTNYFKETQ